MADWIPWIALFGPFAIAGIVLIAARLQVGGRPARGRSAADCLEIQPPVLPDARRRAERRFRLSLPRLSRRPSHIVDDGWQDTLEEASKTLGSRYPYLGMT